MQLLKRFVNLARRVSEMTARLDSIQRALGRIEARQNRGVPSLDFRSAEFQVFSQWGEDGLIQYLLARVPIERTIFIEFGVENYTEANTRFLLQNDNWTGLVLDGSATQIAAMKRDAIYWRHNLKAVCAFIDAKNVNQLFLNEGIQGDIGLLSVDIDGNDYWVWQAISVVSPRIVICEFNALYGPKAEVSIPYDPTFARSAAHSSYLYYGTSLNALVHLGRQKGYSLVGTNSNSNNAFFVRNDLLQNVRVATAEECFREPQYREARDSTGALLFITPAEAISLVASMEVVDVRTERRLPIADIDRG